MESQTDNSSVFIIAGMHRSGTSLTSSLMESAGIDIGQRLIGASFGNPKGHFENSDFVQFHERVLRSQGLGQEGWILQSKVTVSQELRDEANLIIEKNSVSSLWGWKDPRTTLFLDFWSGLLPQAYFIFTYRAPWEVIDSLYRRGDEIFANNPKYALEIWTHYNKLILDFCRRFPERSILLNIENVMSDRNCIFQLCEDKFGVKLREPMENIIDKSLMSSLDLSSHRPLLIKKFFPEIIEVFNELHNQADLKHQASIYCDIEINEPVGDWIMQDWLDLRRITRQSKLGSEKLRQNQSELDRSQSQLQQNQAELDRLQSQLQQAQADRQNYLNIIKSMETSKFWQLREIWFQAKKVFRYFGKR